MCYREEQSLDFSGIHLACLAGDNGHGKSALLDAITWALWGRARARRDDELIALGEIEMWVEFEFGLGPQRYRVWRQRSRKGRGQSDLHFYVWNGGASGGASHGERISSGASTLSGEKRSRRALEERSPESASFDYARQTTPGSAQDAERSEPGDWQLLDEGGLAERQAQIIRTLRLDYETFVNSAFLLQGRADSFTVKTAGERKQILADILGLGRYDLYEERAKQEAQARKDQATRIGGEISGIDAELARRADFEARLQAARNAAAVAVAALRSAETGQAKARLAVQERQSQARQLADLRNRLARAERDLSEVRGQLDAAKARLAQFEAVLAQREEIEAGWAALQAARAGDAAWNARLLRHTQLSENLNRARLAVDQARLALEAESRRLADRQTELARKIATGQEQATILAEAQVTLARMAEQQAHREAIVAELRENAERAATLRSENDRIKADGQALNDKIDMLQAAEAAVCPLCGQPLTADHRGAMLADLTAEHGALAERYRANQIEVKALTGAKARLEAEDAELARELRARDARQRQAAQAEAAVTEAQAAADEQARVAAQITDLAARLSAGDYAAPQRAELAKLQAELAEIDYNAAAHEAIRASVNQLSAFDARYQRQLLPALDGIADVRSRAEALAAQLARREAEMADDRSEAERLAAAVADLPGLEAALKRADAAVEQAAAAERRARLEEGAAQQQISALTALEERRRQRLADLEKVNDELSIYNQLREAFGKKGLQAMIIESAIPEVETEANRLLARMSDNRMSLRLETQREKVTGGVAETLDIIISDELGARAYEMFSVDGNERVFIRRAGLIEALPIKQLWDPGLPSRQIGEYEIQSADCDALCYAEGAAVWMPTAELLRHPAPEKMLRVTFAPGNYAVTLTPNHSIYVMTPQGLIARRVDELQPGDYALAPRNVPQARLQESVDLADFVSDAFLAGREAVNNPLHWDDQCIWSRRDQTQARFVRNDSELAEILGLAVAEASGETILTVSIGVDREMADRVVSQASKIFGVKRTSVSEVPAEVMSRYVATAPGVSSETPLAQFRPMVGGRLLAHIVGNMIGRGASHKRVPQCVFNASREAKVAFLRGLIAGDGHVRIRAQRSQVEASIVTVSPGLVADVLFVCGQLGIIARVERHGDAGFRRGMNHQESYRIAVSGQGNVRELLDKPLELVKYTNQTRLSGIPISLLEIQRRGKSRRIRRDALDGHHPCGTRIVPLRSREQYKRMSELLRDWNVLEVKEIRETAPTDTHVYDLVVPDNHSFVAGTGPILVHNSGGEAFRANLALRIAISKLLARRAGAQLQTLVIDEGFGSQDSQGRSLVVEAINSIQHDFERIIVITHIEELRDLFPARIDVVKTAAGSRVSIA